MKLLLGTHVFLWYIGAHPSLNPGTRDLIRDASNQVFLSPVSLWEALVKNRLGKLPLPDKPELYLARQRVRHGIDTLDLDEASVRWLLASVHSVDALRLFTLPLFGGLAGVGASPHPACEGQVNVVRTTSIAALAESR